MKEVKKTSNKRLEHILFYTEITSSCQNENRMPTFFVVVQHRQMLFVFCLREEKVIFAIRIKTDADAARNSFISNIKKYQLHKVRLKNNVSSKSKAFIT